jgi:hypothetical protein
MHHLDNNDLIGATLTAMTQYEEKNYITFINTVQRYILIANN